MAEVDTRHYYQQQQNNMTSKSAGDLPKFSYLAPNVPQQHVQPSIQQQQANLLLQMQMQHQQPAPQQQLPLQMQQQYPMQMQQGLPLQQQQMLYQQQLQQQQMGMHQQQIPLQMQQMPIQQYAQQPISPRQQLQEDNKAREGILKKSSPKKKQQSASESSGSEGSDDEQQSSRKTSRTRRVRIQDHSPERDEDRRQERGQPRRRATQLDREGELSRMRGPVETEAELPQRRRRANTHDGSESSARRNYPASDSPGDFLNGYISGQARTAPPQNMSMYNAQYDPTMQPPWAQQKRSKGRKTVDAMKWGIPFAKTSDQKSVAAYQRAQLLNSLGTSAPNVRSRDDSDEVERRRPNSARSRTSRVESESRGSVQSPSSNRRVPRSLNRSAPNTRSKQATRAAARSPAQVERRQRDVTIGPVKHPFQGIPHTDADVAFYNIEYRFFFDDVEVEKERCECARATLNHMGLFLEDDHYGDFIDSFLGREVVDTRVDAECGAFILEVERERNHNSRNNRRRRNDSDDESDDSDDFICFTVVLYSDQFLEMASAFRRVSRR